MRTDEQLMMDFQQGSCAAFTELFRRYRQPIFAFFRRRLNDAARAEELAQETFLAVIRAIAHYQPRALVRTYLYAIALNQLLTERRDRAREAALMERDAPDPPEDSNSDVALCVRRALSRLEPEAREVLMLREYDRLSYQEIASLLEIPVNTVRSRLFRARMALKNMLVSQPGI